MTTNKFEVYLRINAQDEDTAVKAFDYWKDVLSPETRRAFWKTSSFKAVLRLMAVDGFHIKVYKKNHYNS